MYNSRHKYYINIYVTLNQQRIDITCGCGSTWSAPFNLHLFFKERGEHGEQRVVLADEPIGAGGLRESLEAAKKGIDLQRGPPGEDDSGAGLAEGSQKTVL